MKILVIGGTGRVGSEVVEELKKRDADIRVLGSMVLGKHIQYTGDDLDSFEAQMREHAPSWSAFDIRMMFQGYIERGFVADDGDTATLTKLLGHVPRSYEDFVQETVAEWQKH
jgi:hypothetical protein